MLETLLTFLRRLRGDPLDAAAILFELLLIALCVNWTASVLQATRGTRPLRGVLISLVVATLIVRILAERMAWERLDLLYGYFLVALAFIALVAFQPELRRAVIRAGEVRFERRRAPQSAVISAIVKSFGYLSKNKFGALIAMQRQVDLRPWAEKGTLLNAEVTTKLINAIFFPNSALHDLGVVIHGSSVVAANCQFPVAESDEVDLSLGSRHLAALGMSYETDALVLVVSEETGTISIADGGKLKRFLSLDDLAEELTSRLDGGAAARDAAQPGLWPRLRRLLVVVPLSFVIWYLADQATLVEQPGLRFEIAVTPNNPLLSAEQVAPPAPAVFSARLRGSTREIERIRNETAERPLRLPWLLDDELDRDVPISRPAREVLDGLLAERGLTVVSTVPETLVFELGELVRRNVRIQAEGQRQRLAEQRFDPAEVTVLMRKRDFERVPEERRYIAVNLEDKLKDRAPDQLHELDDLPLPRTVGGVRVVDIEPRVVRASVRIAAQTQTRRFSGVPVRVAASVELLSLFDVDRRDAGEWLIDVEIRGDQARIDALRPEDIEAFVPLVQELVAGAAEYRALPVKLRLPPGVEPAGRERQVFVRLKPRAGANP